MERDAGGSVEPGGAQAVPRPGPEGKFALATEVVGALERAVRSRRLYEPTHSLYGQSTDDFVQRFLSFLDRYAYLRMEVQADRLTAGERVLLRAAPRDPEIPFRLYKDGIREIRFHRGLTRQEIVEFLSLLEVPLKELSAMGEDLVSLLWSKDFRGIDYTAIDEFEGGPSDFPSDPSEVRKPGSVPGGGGSGGPEAGEAMETGREPDEKIAAPPVPAPAKEELEEAFRHDLRASTERWRLEVESETLGSAIHWSLENLSQLFSEREGQGGRETGAFLRGITGYYLRKPDFAALGQVLSRAEEAGFRTKLPGGNAFFDEILVELRRGLTAAGLLQYLHKSFSGDYDGLEKFIRQAGAEGVAPFAEAYGRVASVHVRRMLRTAIERFPERMTREVVRDLVRNAGRCIDEALAILTAVQPQAAGSEILKCLDNPDPAIRVQAVPLTARLAGVERIAAFTRATADTDPKVRVVAWKLAVEARDPALFPLLCSRAEEKDFGDRVAWERDLLLRALIASDPERAFPVLRSMAERRAPLLQRTRHADVRRAAYLALGLVGSPEAQAYLEQGSNSKDPERQKLCREAIARSRLPASERDPRRPTEILEKPGPENPTGV